MIQLPFKLRIFCFLLITTLLTNCGGPNEKSIDKNTFYKSGVKEGSIIVFNTNEGKRGNATIKKITYDKGSIQLELDNNQQYDIKNLESISLRESEIRSNSTIDEKIHIDSKEQDLSEVVTYQNYEEVKVGGNYLVRLKPQGIAKGKITGIDKENHIVRINEVNIPFVFINNIKPISQAKEKILKYITNEHFNQCLRKVKGIFSEKDVKNILYGIGIRRQHFLFLTLFLEEEKIQNLFHSQYSQLNSGEGGVLPIQGIESFFHMVNDCIYILSQHKSYLNRNKELFTRGNKKLYYKKYYSNKKNRQESKKENNHQNFKGLQPLFMVTSQEQDICLDSRGPLKLISYYKLEKVLIDNYNYNNNKIITVFYPNENAFEVGLINEKYKGISIVPKSSSCKGSDLKVFDKFDFNPMEERDLDIYYVLRRPPFLFLKGPRLEKSNKIISENNQKRIVLYLSQLKQRCLNERIVKEVTETLISLQCNHFDLKREIIFSVFQLNCASPTKITMLPKQNNSYYKILNSHDLDTILTYINKETSTQIHDRLKVISSSLVTLKEETKMNLLRNVSYNSCPDYAKGRLMNKTNEYYSRKYSLNKEAYKLLYNNIFYRKRVEFPRWMKNDIQGFLW